MPTLNQRLTNEQQHAAKILDSHETYWGWQTPAGRIRWQRRVDYLAEAATAAPSNQTDAPSKVLEIGCGTGTFSGALGKLITPLIAVDISDKLLAHARERHPDVVFCQADVHNMAFKDNSFDAVIGCSVLHHLDISMAFASILRVLKPGGVLRFSEPNLLNPQIFLQKTIPTLKKWAGDSPDEYAFTPKDIQRKLEQAGFTAIRVRPFEFLHPHTPPKWIQSVIRCESFLEKSFLRPFCGSLAIEAKK